MKLRCLLFSIFALSTPFALGQAFNDFEISPHDYYEGDADDDFTRLMLQEERGEYSFGTETDLPLVKKLLTDLGIPPSSQVLVFSQTSLQRGLIGPENPRALYFNGDTYLAWMPGGKVEVISFDPARGGMFYVEEPPKVPGAKVRFFTSERCFGCHGGSATNYLPGPLGRSHFTASDGRRVGLVPGHERIGHQVPFADRWGGYFATGTPPSLPHLGNRFVVRNEKRELAFDTGSKSSREDLDDFFDGEKYPGEGSHIVPLLLFNHQIEGHNLLMEARYRYRHLEFQKETLGKPVSRDAKGYDRFFERFVDYLVFKDEASLEGHTVSRNPEFEAAFRENRRSAKDDLSLKDFNLEDRIFEHRLSYLIDSRSFVEAPQGMKNEVYRRLWPILSAEDPPSGYEYFDPEERQRIVQILRETKDDLPDFWYGGFANRE